VSAPARLVTVGEIAAMLAAHVDSLVPELLPRAVIDGDEWRVGSVAGEAGRSMAVNRGNRAGIWKDFGAGDTMRGDALDLVAQVLFRGDKGKAVAWSRSWLGIDDLDPARIAQQRREAEERKRSVLKDAEMKHAQAMRIFIAARPGIRDTPVDAYLRGRGIDLSGLGRQPAAIRFEPRLYNSETDSYYPGMVAAITGGGHSIQAVHRTWLEVLPDGRVVKARDLTEPKKTLASYRGGAIRLWRGETAKPWQSVQPGEWLVIAEGIEDALSAVIVRPNYRTWAAVSISNMANIMLPPEIAGVILMAQNDTEPLAIAAFERAVEHFRRQGKFVKVARPPANVKDANDLLQDATGDSTDHAAGA